MNYMFGAEEDFDLTPGTYFVQFVKPNGYEFTMPNQGTDEARDSDCGGPDGLTRCVTLFSRDIDLDQDCGLIPPQECGIGLDKQCRVETPPPSTGKCNGKLKQFTNEKSRLNRNGPAARRPGSASSWFVRLSLRKSTIQLKLLLPEGNRRGRRWLVGKNWLEMDVTHRNIQVRAIKISKLSLRSGRKVRRMAV